MYYGLKQTFIKLVLKTCKKQNELEEREWRIQTNLKDKTQLERGSSLF